MQGLTTMILNSRALPMCNGSLPKSVPPSILTCILTRLNPNLMSSMSLLELSGIIKCQQIFDRTIELSQRLVAYSIMDEEAPSCLCVRDSVDARVPFQQLIPSHIPPIGSVRLCDPRLLSKAFLRREASIASSCGIFEYSTNAISPFSRATHTPTIALSDALFTRVWTSSKSLCCA